MAQEQFGNQQPPREWLSDTPFLQKFHFLCVPPPLKSQYLKRYEQKTDFFTHFSDLEGSLVAQMVSKQVGNGLEAYLLTFGAHKYPLWTILGSFLVHFGPILAPFWAIFGPKWTKNGGSGAKKGVPEGPKCDQNGPKVSRNYVETL